MRTTGTQQFISACTRVIRRFFDGMRRHRRRVAVLGLCFVAALTTGFWANTPERGRGVSAIRMRVDLTAMPQSPPSRSPVSSYLYAFSPTPPILDRGYFRATVRDAVKNPPKHEERSGGKKVRISFLDSLLSMDRIHSMEPELHIPSWTHSDTQRHNSEWLAEGGWIYGHALPANECELPADSSVAEDMRRLLFRMNLPIMPESLTGRSEKYISIVETAAKRFGLSPQLIFGIMRTESSFNPFAVSNAGALGLMQLVPDSAAAEVHSYLGKAGNPTRTLLFDPKQNIEYGSAYLHLLSTRYFPQVSNQTSRELCVIAAYNAGPGAVLRLFDPNKDAAINAINQLSPEELYARFVKEMPAEETRQYIGKVLSAANTYQGG